MLYGKPVYKTIMIGTYNDTLISIYDYPYESHPEKFSIES